MKIIINKDELSQGVQTIQSALAARTTLPILLNFLLETEGQRVKVVSTDLQMGVKHYLNAAIETDGSVTIPARKFSEILHSLPESEDIELSSGPNSKISLRCGRSRFAMTGAPKSEYPVLPDFNKENSFELPAAVIGRMLRKTIFAAAPDEVRHTLNGVFWSAKDGKLEIVATDGRRLAVASEDVLPKDKNFGVIVPSKFLSEFIRILGVLDIKDGDEEKVLIAVTDNQITFQIKGTTLLSRLVSGSFPSYQQVLPVDKDVVVKAVTRDLLATTKRASLCAVDKGGVVKFALKKGLLQVTASSPNNEFSEDLPVEYEGEDFVVGYNPLFVVDALRHIDTEKTVISMKSPVLPALFEPIETGTYRYVVMPMRL